jgi:hypothetical protein
MAITWLPEHKKGSQPTKKDYLIISLCALFIILVLFTLGFYLYYNVPFDNGTIVGIIVVALCIIEIVHRLKKFNISIRFS